MPPLEGKKRRQLLHVILAKKKKKTKNTKSTLMTQHPVLGTSPEDQLA